MPRLVADVVQGARDRHVSFDEQRHPSGPVYRWLASYVQELQAKIASRDSSAAGVTSVVAAALPLANFDAGIDLGANVRAVLGVAVVDKATVVPQQTYKVTLIDRDQQFAPNGPLRAAWQDGSKLILRGPDILWSPFGSVEVRITSSLTAANAQALQAQGATLPVPDEATRCIEDALALFMAQRTGDPAIVQTFGPAADASERAYLDSITESRIGVAMFVEDTYRP